MKMFCNKRFLEAGKLMMFRDVRAVGAGGWGRGIAPIQILTDQLNLSQLGGLIVPTILIHSPRISRHSYDSERCLAAPASEDLDVVF